MAHTVSPCTMVEQPQYIQNPTEIVNLIFSRECTRTLAGGLDLDTACQSNWGIPTYFQDILNSDPARVVEVPTLLGPGCAPSGSLVRYRCMIQDIFNPQFYSCFYTDTSDVSI